MTGITASTLSTLCNGWWTNEQSNAISSAQKLLGTTDGDNDRADRATAMCAYNVMLNQKILFDDDPNIKPMTLDQIITQDIKDLLVEDTDPDETAGWQYDNSQPTANDDAWEVDEYGNQLS